MTFAEAMDRLGFSAAEVSEALGVAPQTIYQMRMAPESTGYRAPPADWAVSLAKVARQHGGELLKLADELEGKARKPHSPRNRR